MSGEHVVVTEFSNHRIQIFKTDGTPLSVFGEKGKEEGQFQFPYGVVFNRYFGSYFSLIEYLSSVDLSREKEIIVCDNANSRVQILNMEGRFLRQFGSPGTLFANIHIVRKLGRSFQQSL